MMNRMFMLSLTTLLLAACGSSEPKKTESVNQAPTVSIPNVGEVINLQTVEFSASANDADNNLASTEFSLSSNGEVLVTSDTTNFTYQFPYSEVDVGYQLSITATDSDGLSANSVQEFTVPASNISIKAYEPLVSLQEANFEIELSNIDTSQLETSLTLQYLNDNIASHNSNLVYKFPIHTEKTPYKLKLEVYNTGKKIIENISSFEIDPISVSFELPFNSISMRYIDVIAKVENIAENNLSSNLKLSNPEYQIETLASNHIRFFAHKKYTADNGKENKPQGDGYSEEISAIFTFNNEEYTLDFSIQPFQSAPIWPVRQSATNLQHLNTNKSSIDVDKCLNGDEHNIKLFKHDFNDDGMDDFYCVDESGSDYVLYFYLSQGADSYLEQIVSTDLYQNYANYLLANHNDKPYFLAVDSQRNIMLFEYNATNQNVELKNTFPTESELGYSKGFYFSASNSGFLLGLTYPENDYDDVYGYADYTISISDFTYYENDLIENKNIILEKVDFSNFIELAYDDVNEDGISELVFHFSDKELDVKPSERLILINNDFSKSIDFGEFHTISRQNIDEDPYQEIIAEGFVIVGSKPLDTYKHWKLTGKSHLTLNELGEKQVNKLEDFLNNDLFFYFYSIDYPIDPNSDLALLIYQPYSNETNSPPYTTLNKHVLIRNEQIPVDLKDRDADGDLDLVIDNSIWIENPNGYPIQAIIDNYQQSQK
ncbi:Ig-like domain-containing protein [Pseudoalteromonas sp. T1lg24]|uniref:Ig-like domain-containing protein n=1 Tax=Pseudoalteromonas sp. T1lg24 TaxID=2077099 RepID=UPI000CF60A7A|nr:Ig-like domain-containing protein [Pseudoalteromonas sp. T1lg24]